jgi:predicted Na+-dependent transporter
MSFSLKASAIFRSFLNFRGLGSSVLGGYFLTSFSLYFLAKTLFPETKDLFLGLIAVGAAPCTLASAVIWTKLSRGNEALAFAITILSNLSCFIFSSLILFIMLGHSVTLPLREIMQKLFVVNVLPVTAGQVLRIWLPEYGDRFKPMTSNICRIFIILIVLASVSHASDIADKVEATGSIMTGMTILLLIAAVGAAHLAALLGCGLIAWLARSPAGDIVAIMFGGSQKTLPLGIYISEMLASATPGETLTFVALPILIYHATQLTIDSFAIGPCRKYIIGKNDPA